MKKKSTLSLWYNTADQKSAKGILLKLLKSHPIRLQKWHTRNKIIRTLIKQKKIKISKSIYGYSAIILNDEIPKTNGRYFIIDDFPYQHIIDGLKELRDKNK